MTAAGADGADYVLVVDDDEDIRGVIADVLRLHGQEVETAANGAEALAVLRARSHRARLILLDLMMPVMDGWQFRAIQRDDPELADIPVIILSGQGRLFEQARGLGGRAILYKPIDLLVLLTVVRQHLVH